MSRIVVSNGFGQFHLRGLGVELESLGELAGFISGAVPPTHLAVGFPAALARSARIRRLLERRVQIPQERVHQMLTAESLHQVSQALRRRGSFRAADAFEARSFDTYANGATRLLSSRSSTGTIYHVRAGVGGSSISAARARGMRVICDHSIVAPGVIDQYVPQAPPTKQFPRLWSRIQHDIDASDGVIVNSDFVASTFAETGYPIDQVRVAYTPVDATFASMVDALEKPRGQRPVVTFAGTAEYRKGIDVVARVIGVLGTDAIDWRVIGDWSADAAQWRTRLSPDVVVQGKLSRSDLARVLAETDVFLFPSRAEGSARVAAEALRAGCQLVTSRMTGSAARDGVDGHIHSNVDDVDAIAQSVADLVSADADSRTKSMRRTKDYASARLSSSRYVADVMSAYSDFEVAN